MDKKIEYLNLVRTAVDDTMKAYKHITLDDLAGHGSTTPTDYLDYAINRLQDLADAVNAGRPKADHIHVGSDGVACEVAAYLVYATGDVGVSESGRVVYYNHMGAYAGTWREDIKSRSYSVCSSTLERDVFYDLMVRDIKRMHKCGLILEKLLAEHGKTIRQTLDSCLVPCKNGVVDLRSMDPVTGTCAEFTPYCLPDGSENPGYYKAYTERGIYFYNKLATPWIPYYTQNPLLRCDDGFLWGVDRHLQQVFRNDPNKIRLFWEIANFAFRGISGGYSFWFVDSVSRGNVVLSGGGNLTTANLISNVIGMDNVMYMHMIQYDKPYVLEDLRMKRAVISYRAHNEDKPIDRPAGVFGKLVAGEEVDVRAKWETKRLMRYQGMILQCSDAVPQVLDPNSTVAQRTRALLFDQPVAFTPGSGRKDIRDKLTSNDLIRQYVLHRALSFGPILRYTPSAIAATVPPVPKS